MRDLLVPESVYLDGLGMYLPDTKVDVQDAIARGDCDAETAQVGWVSTRVAGDEPAPDLAIKAARQAIARSAHTADEFALLLHACAWHQGPEGWSPQHYIQRHTIGGNSPAIGLRQGCNAGLACMEVAIPYLLANPERQAALVCTADNFGTPLYDRWRAHRAVVYGDAGAAMVLSTRQGFARVLSIGSKSMPQFEELSRGVEPLFPPGVTVGRPLDFEQRMAGYESDLLYEAREHVPTLGADIANLVLDAVGLTIADVTRVVHQATGSEMFLQVLLGPLGVETGRGILRFGQENGRFGAADQIAGLVDLVAGGEVKPGDHVLMLGGGPGMSATAAVLAIEDVPAWSDSDGS